MKWDTLVGFCLALSLVLAGGARAADSPPQQQSFELLYPNAYQSFVANWQPADGPLCAVIRTAADWDRVLKPAATMGRARPFAPPPEFWHFKALLLVARVISAGDASGAFQVERVSRDAGGLELDYRFAPTPPAASTMKWYLALAVPKPLPLVVRFKENRRLICTLRTRDVAPITPPLPTQ